MSFLDKLNKSCELDPIFLSIDAAHFGSKWYLKKLHCKSGNRVRFRLHIINCSERVIRDLMIRVILVSGLEYVHDSAVMFNSARSNGSVVSDAITTSDGLRIGNCAPRTDAWLYFDAIVREIDEKHTYRAGIQVCFDQIYTAYENADIIL